MKSANWRLLSQWRKNEVYGDGGFAGSVAKCADTTYTNGAEMPAASSTATSEPEYYIFVTNNIEWEPHTSGSTIARTLAGRNLWLASSYTPYRKKYKRGDRVLFYVAGRNARFFIGDGVIAGPTTQATDKDIALAQKLGLDGFAERIPLHSVRLWSTPLPLKPLVDALDFIKDKRNYGLHFRQATTRIAVKDFAFILAHVEEANGAISLVCPM